MQIHLANKADISSMVNLSYQKRKAYEKAQGQFWRYAEGAEESQSKWFEELLIHKDYIILIAKSENIIKGFIIGRLLEAPEVYDPGGLTLMIDDFCIDLSLEWEIVGKQLMDEIRIIAKQKGATQFCIVSGAHDDAKCKFLENFGLNAASKWYVGSV